MYDCVHAVLFYALAAGLEDGIDRSGRVSVGESDPSAVFSKKIFVFSRDVSVCLYAECSVSDIQRRSCRRGNVSVYLQTDLLAGSTNVFWNRPMETGGKKNRHTGRLTP